MPIARLDGQPPQKHHKTQNIMFIVRHSRRITSTSAMAPCPRMMSVPSARASTVANATSPASTSSGDSNVLRREPPQNTRPVTQACAAPRGTLNSPMMDAVSVDGVPAFVSMPGKDGDNGVAPVVVQR